MNKQQLLQLKIKGHDLKGKAQIFFNYIELAMKFINLMANYSYTLVFINAYKYQSRYISDLTFENFYITQYFKHVDTRRYKNGARVLFPLKKVEQALLCTPFSVFLPDSKKQTNVKFKVFLHLALIIALVTTLLVDFLVYDFMSILNRINKITYTYNSAAKLNFNVTGTGFMANTIRSILNDTSIDEEKNLEEKSDICSPKVSKLEVSHIKALGLNVVLLLIAMLVEVFLKRMNRSICAFYYRKQEKKRIIWLYNYHMKKRLDFIANAKRKLLEKQQKDLINYEFDLMGFLLNPLKKSHIFLKVARLMGLDRVECMLCAEKQPELKCHKCNVCFGVFCWQCFVDIEEKCLLCG